MPDLILEYDIMESIVEYSKALGKQANEYGESLDSKITAAIGNVTGGSSGNLTNASDSVNEKIKALKQKSEAFYQFAAQISNLLEVAQQIDQEVADAIAAQKDRFLDHHKSLRIENWKEKFLDLLVDLEISSALLALISKILNVLSDVLKSSKDAIKDWYKSAEGKVIRAGTPVGIAANGIPGLMPYGNGKFPGSKNGKGIDGLDLKDTILKWYEYPGIFADMAGNSGKGSTNTTTEKPEFTIGPATGDCVPVPDYPQLGSTAALVLGLDSTTGGLVINVMNAANTLIGKPLITKEVIDYNKKNTYDFAERYKMAQVLGIGATAYAVVAGATEAAIMEAVLESSGNLSKLTQEELRPCDIDFTGRNSNLSKLTQEEINAINKYTGDDYEGINRSLRGLDEATDANKITIKNMKSALSKASLPEDMTLYRGTDKVELGNLKDLSPEELIGKTFEQPSFMSTSTKDTVATDTFQGDMHMTIEAPKGSKGMDIASISQYGGTESEVLFQAGTEMIIKDATMVDNVLNIVVEIIN